LKPYTELFREQLQLDDRRYALVNDQQETELVNVFAIGDVSSPLAPTISSAAGTGATAAKVIASRLGGRLS
jgi:thioredoxin reductase